MVMTETAGNGTASTTCGDQHPDLVGDFKCCLPAGHDGWHELAQPGLEWLESASERRDRLAFQRSEAQQELKRLESKAAAHKRFWTQDAEDLLT